jgi:hypothetical protein
MSHVIYKKLCENYVELETGSQNKAISKRKVIETSVTFGVKIGLLVSVDQRHVLRERDIFFCAYYTLPPK